MFLYLTTHSTLHSVNTVVELLYLTVWKDHRVRSVTHTLFTAGFLGMRLMTQRTLVTAHHVLPSVHGSARLWDIIRPRPPG